MQTVQPTLLILIPAAQTLGACKFDCTELLLDDCRKLKNPVRGLDLLQDRMILQHLSMSVNGNLALQRAKFENSHVATSNALDGHYRRNFDPNLDMYGNGGMGKYDCQRFLPKAWRQQKAHSIISVPQREPCRFICFRSPLFQDSFEIGRISYNLTIACLQKSQRVEV
jgi:hypothetical protein